MPTPTIPGEYRIVPLDAGFLRRARDDGLDDQGQAVQRHVAAGGEPLRDVLRRALPGEELILASYCPFELAGPYREYGPVFILAGGAGAPDLSRLPAGPGDYFGDSFVLRAYSGDERIVDATLSSPGAASATLRDYFLRDEVAFVLARFAAYGCYGCRLERRPIHGGGERGIDRPPCTGPLGASGEATHHARVKQGTAPHVGVQSNRSHYRRTHLARL